MRKARFMGLRQELGLKKGFRALEHEAMLSIYYTASRIKKRADEFFRPFGLTDVQFNVMMLLAYQSGSEGGLSQAKLSDMMLVNRANVTSLIDRMEKVGLVKRTTSPKDRRFNIVRLTLKGKKLLARVEPMYVLEVKRIMTSASSAEQKKLVATCEKIRSKFN